MLAAAEVRVRGNTPSCAAAFHFLLTTTCAKISAVVAATGWCCPDVQVESHEAK